MLLPQNQWQDHKTLGFMCTEFSSTFAASSPTCKRHVPFLALYANPGSEDIEKKNKGRRGEKKKEKVRVKKPCINAKHKVGNIWIADYSTSN